MGSRPLSTKNTGTKAQMAIQNTKGAFMHKYIVVVLILSREASKQLALSVVTGDKPAYTASNENDFVCTCLRTHSTADLNEKLSKNVPRRAMSE